MCNLNLTFNLISPKNYSKFNAKREINLIILLTNIQSSTSSFFPSFLNFKQLFFTISPPFSCQDRNIGFKFSDCQGERRTIRCRVPRWSNRQTFILYIVTKNFPGDLDLVKHPEKHLQSQICAAFKVRQATRNSEQIHHFHSNNHKLIMAIVNKKL